MQNIGSQQRQGTFIAHSNGANALVNMRTIEQWYNNPVSARLYEVAYSQMVIPLFLTTSQAFRVANLAAATWQSTRREGSTTPGQ